MCVLGELFCEQEECYFMTQTNWIRQATYSLAPSVFMMEKRFAVFARLRKKISRRCAMFPFNDPMNNGYVMDFLDTLHASFAMANFVYFTSFGCFLVKDKNKSLNFLNWNLMQKCVLIKSNARKCLMKLKPFHRTRSN